MDLGFKDWLVAGEQIFVTFGGFFCCGKWMFETIGWGMNYPNEDDGGWVDAMCWQLLVSLDLSRSFTEFPEWKNFKTIWLFEEFHLIHDTS